MSDETILTGARIVLDDAVVDGTLVVRGRCIRDIQPGTSHAPGALDLEGDWLLPGLIELHTDNLERQFQPRPAVRWPADAAMLQHDRQIAGAGITTVCDAVCIGFYGGKHERLDYLRQSLDVLRRGRAAGALKADHFLHLRLEVTDPDCVELFEPLLDEPTLEIVSFMDHTPGQRQWHDLERYRTFHMGREIKTEAEFQAMIARRIANGSAYALANRARILALLEGHPAVRASHDDATPEHVAEAVTAGVSVAEFPITMAAAEAARAAGLDIVMGAPNLILGGSHSGNISAADLAHAGLLDVFSSDYVPASLIQAAFRLGDDGWTLPEAVATVTRNPARVLRLDDRGRLAPKRRADLLRVRQIAGTPAVVAVWREGGRIA